MMQGVFLVRAVSMARVIFSPAAAPMAPPQKRKSITATETLMPVDLARAAITASGRPLSFS